MIWLTWRQSRLEVLIGGSVLALVAVLLLWTGYQLHDAYNDAGLPSCAAQSPSDEGCLGAAEDFLNQHQSFTFWMGWLNLLPFLLGLLLAAPTILDLEQGTYRLAWTQSVTRARWMATRIGFGVAIAALASGVLTLIWSWWRRPFDAIEGRFVSGESFDFVGIVPFAYVTFAFALCLTLGTLLRRTIPAVGIGLVGFLAARIGVMENLRPRYLEPTKLTWDLNSQPASAAQNQFFGAGNWIISEGYVDATGLAPNQGQGIPMEQDCMLETTSKSGAQFNDCLSDQGIMYTLVYQPADRFWIFQAIETALFLGLAAGLLGFTFWWVTKRVA